MPLNAMVGGVVIFCGLGLGALGKLSAHHLGDLISDTDFYSHRAFLNKQVSVDRNFRLYHQMFGSPMPFEKRIVPAWMNYDEKQVSNYRQYTRLEWQNPEKLTTTQYKLQNADAKAAYRDFDEAYPNGVSLKTFGPAIFEALYSQTTD